MKNIEQITMKQSAAVKIKKNSSDGFDFLVHSVTKILLI